MKNKLGVNRIIALLIICFLSICFFDVEKIKTVSEIQGKLQSKESFIENAGNKLELVLVDNNSKYVSKNSIEKKENKKEKNNNNIKINAVQNIYNSLQKDEEICYGVSFGYAFCNRHFIITFIHNKDGSK